MTDGSGNYAVQVKLQGSMAEDQEKRPTVWALNKCTDRCGHFLYPGSRGERT